MTTGRAFGLAVLAAAAGVLATAAYDHPNIYDEGVVVLGTLRLLGGDVPYRDYWTMYPPGVFLLFATVFQLFGATLFVERTASLLLAAALAAGCGAGAARWAGPVWGLWTAALVTLWLYATRLHASAVVPALIGAIGVAWLLRGETTTARRAVAAGGLTAIAALFRHDLAAYTCIAAAVSLMAARQSRAAGVYVLTAAAGVAAAAATLVALAGAGPVVDQLIVFPIQGFPRVRALPYPSSALAIGPPLVALAAIVLAARARVVEPLTLAIAGLLLVAQSVVRSDFGHVLPSFVAGVTAFAMSAGDRRTTRGSALGWTGALAVAVFAVWALPEGGEPPARHAWRLPVAAGLYSAADPRPYEDAVALVQRLTPPGAAIFVGSDRHDRLFINDVLFYVLADRRPATAYHELHPGVATTAAVQREIVSGLEAHDVQVVVLRTEQHPPELDNESSQSSGVTILDEYLRATFAPAGRFGEYEVRQRIRRGSDR